MRLAGSVSGAFGPVLDSSGIGVARLSSARSVPPGALSRPPDERSGDGWAQASQDGLPDFVVIGAMRAATTRLHRLLDTHPAIAMSREKETDYFVAERNFDRGIDWYRSLFPAASGRLLGETSPNYAKFDIFPGVHRRMVDTLPLAKLIYLVRDPVARAMSHYRFAATMGREPPGSAAVEHMLTTSRYASQLELFCETYPAERILVVDFDRLVGDPASTMAGIAGFLGLPSVWDVPGGMRADNAGDEIRRMPRWFLHLRKLRAVSDMRRHLPRPIADGMRRLIASGSGRPEVEVPDDVAACFRAGLAHEAARLREMTGLAFARWSL